MRSPEPLPAEEARRALSEGEAETLLAVARASIAHGLACGRPLDVGLEGHPPALRLASASFVTLQLAGTLRGCVGELEPRRPLAVSVACNAFAAAFRDPRFGPLRADEASRLELHVSVLSALEPLAAASEQELLAALRPGADGLVLDDGRRRATFLPAVWRTLAEPREFVRALGRKAGLPAEGWPPELRAWRYSVEEIPRHAGGPGSEGADPRRQ